MTIDQPRDAAVHFRAKQAPFAVRARDQTPAAIARLAIGVAGRRSIDGKSHIFDPAHRAVARQVLKQQAAGVSHPDQAFQPPESGREFFERRVAQDIMGKSGVADVKAGH